MSSPCIVAVRLTGMPDEQRDWEEFL